MQFVVTGAENYLKRKQIKTEDITQQLKQIVYLREN